MLVTLNITQGALSANKDCIGFMCCQVAYKGRRDRSWSCAGSERLILFDEVGWVVGITRRDDADVAEIMGASSVGWLEDTIG